jgi:hypothetical protein
MTEGQERSEVRGPRPEVRVAPAAGARTAYWVLRERQANAWQRRGAGQARRVPPSIDRRGMRGYTSAGYRARMNGELQFS